MRLQRRSNPSFSIIISSELGLDAVALHAAAYGWRLFIFMNCSLRCLIIVVGVICLSSASSFRDLEHQADFAQLDGQMRDFIISQR